MLQFEFGIPIYLLTLVFIIIAIFACAVACMATASRLIFSMLKELGDWDVSTPHILFLEGARWRRNQLDLYDKQYQLEQP